MPKSFSTSLPQDFAKKFDAFWEQSVRETQAYELKSSIKEVDFGLPFFRCYDVSFSGYMGQSIDGWLIVPRRKDAENQALNLVVEFLGYGNGRGLPFERMLWPNFGFAYFVMDTRGQGCGWPGGPGLAGTTPDIDDAELAACLEATGHYPGFLTKGIHSPHSYYYRRLFCDGFRAVEWLQTLQNPNKNQLGTDLKLIADKIFLLGHSQGAALSLAVAALAERFLDQVDGVLANLPFLCDIRNSVSLVDSPPYSEIQSYLCVHVDREEQVFQTLAYFDTLHFAKRSTCPALFSAAKRDTVCPFASIELAYQEYVGKQKELVAYPWHGHEGGGAHFVQKQKIFLQELTK